MICYNLRIPSEILIVNNWIPQNAQTRHQNRNNMRYSEYFKLK